MIKKIMLLASCALAISPAIAGNLLAHGDIINIKCTGIQFSLEKTGDSYRANLPDKTIEYSEFTADGETFNFVSSDEQGNYLNALRFGYVSDYLNIDSEETPSQKLILSNAIQSLMKNGLKREMINNFKHQGVDSVRAAKFNTPLQITITGIHQQLDSISFSDAADDTKNRTYERCSFM